MVFAIEHDLVGNFQRAMQVHRRTFLVCCGQRCIDGGEAVGFAAGVGAEFARINISAIGGVLINHVVAECARTAFVLPVGYGI